MYNRRQTAARLSRLWLFIGGDKVPALPGSFYLAHIPTRSHHAPDAKGVHCCHVNSYNFRFEQETWLPCYFGPFPWEKATLGTFQDLSFCVPTIHIHRCTGTQTYPCTHTNIHTHKHSLHPNLIICLTTSKTLTNSKAHFTGHLL